MKRFSQRGLSLLLALAAVICLANPVRAAGSDDALEAALADTAQYVCAAVPEPRVGSIGGEWAVLGLARSGYYDNTVIWRAQYGFAVQGGDAGGTGSGGATIWSNNPYPLEADSSLRHYAGALCAAFAQGGEVTGGNSQFYFVTALPNSVDETMQQQLRDNGYSDEQVSAYAAAGGLPYLDNTDTVFGQVYAGMDVVDQIACVPTVKNEDETDTYRPQEDSAVTIYKVTIDNYPGPSADDTADSAASDSSAQ